MCGEVVFVQSGGHWLTAQGGTLGPGEPHHYVASDILYVQNLNLKSIDYIILQF